MLGGLGHKIGDAYRNVVATVSSQNSESQFLSKGMLTPDEFVEAGDQLTYKFPTWQWEAGEASRRASWLPADKQMMITRNVPCKERVRALDYVLDHKTRTEDGWTLPETINTGDSAPEEIKDVDELNADAQGGADSTAASEGSGFGGIMAAQDDFITTGEDGAVPDFSELDAALADDDPAAAPAFGGGAGYVVAEAPDANIVKTRTYDLTITYDKYYQTPRLWLSAFDEANKPLKPEAVYEDVLSEYVTKTVTVDPHPLTGVPTVSIHPCKHSQVMHKVAQEWQAQGKEVRPDLAIFVFLKFMSSIIPTINYDFTMDIEMAK